MGLAATGGVILVVVYVGLVTRTESFSVTTALSVAYILSFLAAGVVVWLRRPDYRTGKLLVLAGYLACVGALQRFPESGAMFAIGTSLNGLQEVALAYMLLTYPSGRPGPSVAGQLARRSRSWAPCSGWASCSRGRTVRGPFGACSEEPNPFLVVDLGTRGDLSIVVLAVAGVAMLIVVAWRFFSAHGATRRALAPMLIAGLIAAAGVTLRQVFAGDVAVANIARALQFLIPWPGNRVHAVSDGARGRCGPRPEGWPYVHGP